jgi:hypothetical protein
MKLVRLLLWVGTSVVGIILIGLGILLFWLVVQTPFVTVGESWFLFICLFVCISVGVALMQRSIKEIRAFKGAFEAS